MKYTVKNFKNRYFPGGLVKTSYCQFIIPMLLVPILNGALEMYANLNPIQSAITAAALYLAFTGLFVVIWIDGKDNVKDLLKVVKSIAKFITKTAKSLLRITTKLAITTLKKIGEKSYEIANYLEKFIDKEKQ